MIERYLAELGRRLELPAQQAPAHPRRVSRPSARAERPRAELGLADAEAERRAVETFGERRAIAQEFHEQVASAGAQRSSGLTAALVWSAFVALLADRHPGAGRLARGLGELRGLRRAGLLPRPGGGRRRRARASRARCATGRRAGCRCTASGTSCAPTPSRSACAGAVVLALAGGLVAHSGSIGDSAGASRSRPGPARRPPSRSPPPSRSSARSPRPGRCLRAVAAVGRARRPAGGGPPGPGRARARRRRPWLAAPARSSARRSPRGSTCAAIHGASARCSPRPAVSPSRSRTP